MRRTIVTLVACAMAATAGAQPVDRPRLDAARVTGEVVAGAYVGIGGYFLGKYVAGRVSNVLGIENEGTHRAIGLIGGGIGGGLATAGVVYAIGSMGDTAGDFNATVLGTTAGFVVAVGVARLVLGPGVRPPAGMSTAARWATANVLALLPAIGGTIGFNSTRRTQ